MEKQETLSRKNIHSGRKICEPSFPTWPKLSDEVDDEIKEKIERVFKSHETCLRQVSKHEDKKTGKTSPLTESEISEKKTFSSTFVIGFNAVIRKLETNQLRLVVMNKITYPAVLKKAILSLAMQQRCPAIELSDLASLICKSWPAVKSVTCLGIVKTDTQNKFDDLVSYITKKNLLPSDNHISIIDTQSLLNEMNKAKLVEKKHKRVEEKWKVKPTRPVLDFTKYYKKLQDKGCEKKFDGQSFISFTNEVCDEVVIFRNGIKITEELDKDTESYGIKPFTTKGSQDVPIKGVKRKFDATVRKSSYKSINVQQLNQNIHKMKKAKKNKNKTK